MHHHDHHVSFEVKVESYGSCSKLWYPKIAWVLERLPYMGTSWNLIFDPLEWGEWNPQQRADVINMTSPWFMGWFMPYQFIMFFFFLQLSNDHVNSYSS